MWRLLTPPNFARSALLNMRCTATSTQQSRSEAFLTQNVHTQLTVRSPHAPQLEPCMSQHSTAWEQQDLRRVQAHASVHVMAQHSVREGACSSWQGGVFMDSSMHSVRTVAGSVLACSAPAAQMASSANPRTTPTLATATPSARRKRRKRPPEAPAALIGAGPARAHPGWVIPVRSVCAGQRCFMDGWGVAITRPLIQEAPRPVLGCGSFLAFSC
jgi:hypothetical protein